VGVVGRIELEGIATMNTSLTACCVATLLFTGAAFAGPNSGSSGPKNNTPSAQKFKSNSPGSAKQKMPKFTPNGASASSPKKFNPTQFTKFKSPNNSANYNLKYGKSFAYGTYYPGSFHRQWSAYGWWPQFGAYVYLDPATNGYYYWNARDRNFYPVAYADVVAPTPNAPLIDNDLTDSPEAPTPIGTGPIMPVTFSGMPTQ
jgi:hypothetical protein